MKEEDGVNLQVITVLYSLPYTYSEELSSNTEIFYSTKESLANFNPIILP